MPLRRDVFVLLTCCVALGWAIARPAAAGSSQQATPRAAASPAAADPRGLLNRYCVTCHNQRMKTAGLTLEAMDLAHVGKDAQLWERVVRKLRAGVMPPRGMPRPEAVAYKGLISRIERELDRAASLNPNPGRPAVFHRLNRTEYQNAIRDLLAIDVDVSALPADAASYGFDNIGDVLGVSPVLLDRYISSARKISRLAVADRSIPPTLDTFVVPTDLTQRDRLDGMPFGTRGGTQIRATFPLDGEYLIRVRLTRDYNGNLNGMKEAHQLEVTLDGERVTLLTVGGAKEAKEKPGDDDTSLALLHADSGLEVRMPAKAGAHVVGVAFLKRPSAQYENVRQPFLRAIVEQGETDDQPYVWKVAIGGPYNGTAPGETETRRRVFVCRPLTIQDEPGCARTIISSLARRAYRRPLTPADRRVLMGFYEQGRAESGFEKGIETVVARILVSPSFLFRIEPDPPGVPPGSNHRVTDLELASRLSFFLWSSIPDDELLTLAEAGRLSQPAVYEKQVRRLLADPRSEALVSNFFGQWLFLRNVAETKPDAKLFPDFDENLRRAFRRETDLFIESVIREDRSALDLLTANYTFVNERLARHYGIPNIYGDHFRRVTLTDPVRGGLLGHGSILTVRSYATRTSPVLRGVWILENILGAPVPPPPPNVPDLRDTAPDGKVLSMRERMVQHRANPVCASCHAVMDPLGLPLENFDAIGRWRTVSESNGPIDVTGALPNGTSFEGVAGLRRALQSHSDEFVMTMTERLMTYALGRGLEYYDVPAIRRIARSAAQNDHRFSSLILGVAKSLPFTMRRTQPLQSTRGGTLTP